MTKTTLIAALTLALNAFAAAPCPPAVVETVQKSYPGSQTTACHEEKEKGHTQWEVKVQSAENKRLELEVSPKGELIQTEEVVAVTEVPTSVLSAFETRYPGQKPNRAERQTKADKSVTWELAFGEKGKGRREATFKDDGTFVEEERS